MRSKTPEKLINEVLEAKAPVFHASANDATEESDSTGSVWSDIYKQLMNGISHMLPSFVIGGGS